MYWPDVPSGDISKTLSDQILLYIMKSSDVNGVMAVNNVCLTDRYSCADSADLSVAHNNVGNFI